MITKSTVVQRMQDLQLYGCQNDFLDHFEEMLSKNQSTLEILNALVVFQKVC